MTASATTRPRLHRVGMVLEFVRGRWRSGQQIVEHVKWLSGQAGQQTAYNSSTGAARNCHWLAKRRGLAWWIMDVNRAEDGPAAPGMGGHRLYCVMRRNECPPHHRAMDAGAEPIGDPRLVSVGAEHTDRSEAEIAERAAVVRGGIEKCSEPTGKVPRVPNTAARNHPAPTHDGLRLGPRAGELPL